MTTISVLTPSLPERAHLLAGVVETVAAQTVPVTEHLIRVARRGPEGLGPRHVAEQRCVLLGGATSEWVATLDDDDRWDPDHVETIRGHLGPDVDVVWSFPRPAHAIARVDTAGWTQLTLRARLRRSNFIPSAAFIRREVLVGVGGWDSTRWDPRTLRYPTGATWEDWDLWIRLADAGARFHCVPMETWTYELGGEHEHATARRR